MFGVLLSVCLIPAALTIIVTDPPPTSTEYNYSYKVLDPHTGDTKSLHEVRRGDVVTGSYTVIDPDGTQRVVEYTADSRRGFKAVVHSEPLAVPVHHVLRNRHFVPRGSTYLNQYYSSHTLYRGHPLPQPLEVEQPCMSNQKKNKNLPDNRQTRYFTPTNEIKAKPLMLKQREYFAPNNGDSTF